MSEPSRRDYFWKTSLDHLIDELETSENGLSLSQVRERLAKYGYNKIVEKKTIPPFLSILISQFENWLVIVLIIAAGISFFLGERIDALIVILIVVASVVFGFLQEYRAEVILGRLKKFISHKVYVKREGKWQEIESKNLVVGDWVRLQVGNLVPADIRLSQAKELSINESVLTGESFLVSKEVGVMRGKGPFQPQDLKNMAFMGTSVMGGYGEGVVVAVGNNTLFAKTVSYVENSASETDFQKQTKRFGIFLFRIIVLMTVFVFLTNSLLGKGTLESFLFAVALAVGITPELLPAIMTITLSQGALEMAKNKVVVKRLMSVENFGNMDTLCTDKTGTLTQGTFSLANYINSEGNKDEEVLLKSLLCTTNFFYNSPGTTNPVDKAIWESSDAVRLKKELEKYELVDQREFDFKSRRMKVLVKDGGGLLVVTKGSLDSILPFTKLLPSAKKEIIKRVEKYEEDGFRVIAIAQKRVKDSDVLSKVETGFSFLGILLFEDPVKSDVKEALDIFRNLGVSVKILSGDSMVVTKKVANEVGFNISDEDVIAGDILEGLSEEKIGEYARKYDFFARVTPEQKYKLIASLNKEGHIVGFLGDGVNDTPALKAADVGIAVDSGTLVAKDTADIVLLRKDLRLLANGVQMSRKTFGNVMKYILNTVSANYGNMFTVALSSLFLKFIPLLPKQILLNNFVSDMPLFTVATDNVDAEFTKRPRRWNFKLISDFMVFFGLISSFFDLMLILPMIFIWKFDAGVFRTTWFLESSLSEMLVTFAIRTQKPFFKSSPSSLLIFTSLFCMAISVLLTVSNFGYRFFEFKPMPLFVWLWIGIVLLLYFLITEIVKHFFFRKYEV